MKKWHVFVGLSLVYCTAMKAQPGASATNHLKGGSSLGSLDISIPVGVFARSHIGGAGLNYSWSNHRYGMNVTPKKLIGFTFNAGADYFLGKRIKPAGYPFRYSGYIYGHIMPGILMNPSAKSTLALTAGPTIGFYKGNTDAGFGINLFGTYFLTSNIAIGPGITYKKHSEADALWTGSIRASFLF